MQVNPFYGVFLDFAVFKKPGVQRIFLSLNISYQGYNYVEFFSPIKIFKAYNIFLCQTETKIWHYKKALRETFVWVP